MNAYVSTELSMIQMLDPQRHELALLQEAFLNKGGTIEVLQGPSFKAPPVRNDPPPSVKVAKPVKKSDPVTAYIDKITQRDIDREERVAQRAKEKAEKIAHVRKLAATMTHTQAVEATGMPLRSLQRLAKQGDFKFQLANNGGHSNLKPKVIDDEFDAKTAERIRAFIEVGLSRTQAMTLLGIRFPRFNRILTKFAIDYPKRRAGPHPAFFEKPVKA